jgi:hypothetical protein
VTNSLYHYYALFTGQAVTQTQVKMLYVETTLASAAGQLRHLLADRRHDFFCLNDGSLPEIPVEQRTRQTRAFLEKYFPVAAPWENTGRAAPQARIETSE